MDANEDIPKPIVIPPGGTAVDARQNSQPRSLWQASRNGLRRLIYVTGAILALPVIAVLALTSFGLGAGRGLVMPSMLPDVIGFSITCVELLVIPICAGGSIAILVNVVVAGKHGTARSGYRRERWPWLVGAWIVLAACDRVRDRCFHRGGHRPHVSESHSRGRPRRSLLAARRLDGPPRTSARCRELGPGRAESARAGSSGLARSQAGPRRADDAVKRGDHNLGLDGSDPGKRAAGRRGCRRAPTRTEDAP